MNRKVFFITAGMLLICSDIVFADKIEAGLKVYLNEGSFDLLGRNYDKTLFKLLDEYSDNKLQYVMNDIKTIPLQIKCLNKIFKQNSVIYSPIAFLSILKGLLPAKEFSDLILKILKIAIK